MPVNEKFPLALPEGTVLAGQYTIEKVLGQGGFGISYKARDHKNNIDVAIKEFFPDTLAYREHTKVISYPGERTENYEYGKQSFLEEAKTLSKFIGCENIVRIYSYFEENQTAYFVMEFIEGVSFDKYISEHGGKIDCEDAKRILIPVMDALAAVHSQGIIHRDVTPDNIYITNSGTVKLLDFGAARYSLGDKSRSLDVILKHGFAPKEQYTRHGRQGPFTDVYSLGATFYYALTGRRPPDSVDRLEEDDLIPPSTLGARITDYEEQAILQALNVQPSERFQTMTAFKTAFMDEAGYAPAPAAAAPVQQQFFSAPVEPVQAAAQPQTQYVQTAQTVAQFAQPVQTAALYPQPDTAPDAVPPQPQETARRGFDFRKLLDKKYLIPSAAALVVLVGCIVTINIAVNSSKNAGGTADSQPDYIFEDTSAGNSLSNQADPIFTTSQPQTSQPQTTQPQTTQPQTTQPAEQQTAYGDTEIIGSFTNIQNGGLASGNYRIGSDQNKIISLKDDTIIKSFNDSIKNLCYDSGRLYFLKYMETGWQACYYDESDGGCYTVGALKGYSNISAMYLSKDYYFIYVPTSVSIERGHLYRISRSTGKEEQSIELNGVGEFAIGGGNVIYISPDYSSIHSVSALDFEQEIKYYWYDEESTWEYHSVTAADNGIYALVTDRDNFGIGIINYDANLQNKNAEKSYNISDLTNPLKDKDNLILWHAYYLCALDGHFVLNIGYVVDGDNYKTSKYVVTPSSRTNYIDDAFFEDQVLGSVNIYAHCILKMDNNYKVFAYDMSDGSTDLYYRLYDKNGNRITNN